jgi:hypothetical protein
VPLDQRLRCSPVAYLTEDYGRRGTRSASAVNSGDKALMSAGKAAAKKADDVSSGCHEGEPDYAGFTE